MKKIKMLEELWEFLKIDDFVKKQFGNYEDLAKNKFFKNGIKKQKKDIINIYNLQNYGYYKNSKIKLYYDIID
jgi:hypothetical protein